MITIIMQIFLHHILGLYDLSAEAAGYADMVYHTWAGWRALGRQVIHTSEAVFQVEVADPTTRKGSRIQSYFTYDQTQPAPMA